MQLFNTGYVSRGMGNLRTEVDDLLFRLLTGYLKDSLGHESKLRTLRQKAELLMALQPADRLRTLGLVCLMTRHLRLKAYQSGGSPDGCRLSLCPNVQEHP